MASGGGAFVAVGVEQCLLGVIGVMPTGRYELVGLRRNDGEAQRQGRSARGSPAGRMPQSTEALTRNARIMAMLMERWVREGARCVVDALRSSVGSWFVHGVEERKGQWCLDSDSPPTEGKGHV